MSASPTPARRPSLLVASIPLFGHLGPVLRLGAELARRGWRVTVATSEEGRQHVERVPGVEFCNLGHGGMELAEAERIIAEVTAEPDLARGTLKVLSGMAQTWTPMFDGLRAHVAKDRPDVMLVDLATTAGLDVAGEAGIPCVVNNADLLTVLPAGLLPAEPAVPLLFSRRSIHDVNALDRLLYPLRRWLAARVGALIVGRIQNRCRALRALPPVDFNTRLQGTPIINNSAFGLEYARALPPLMHMVGPILPPDEPLSPTEDSWLRDGKPVVFVNMGTVATPSKEHVQKIAEGLASDRFRALWVLRAPSQPWLPANVPSNIRVTTWVSSQMGVLKHPNVRAFVSHCGTNSVQESLACGTPVVGFPMFAAQEDMGLRVMDARVGVALDKHHFTPDALRDAVTRVMEDPAFRKNIPAIQSSFRLAGGVGRAADVVEDFAKVGAAHLSPGWKAPEAA